MFSFKDYLVEAQFSEDDFNRVIGVFTKRLPRLLGSKVYRYGGDGYVEKLGGGSRITFLFGTKAYGVRFKGNTIKGIDVWSEFTTNTAPDFFINVSKLTTGSLISSIAKLAQIIKNPKEGDMEVKAVHESVSLTEMAKRVTDQDFYKMVVDEVGKSGAESVSWDQVKDVADQNDVTIPGYIKRQKIGRGVWNAKPGATGGDDDDDDKGSSSNDDDDGDDEDTKTVTLRGGAGDPVFKIKVTGQTGPLPTGDNAAAKALYAKIRDTISSSGKPTDKELRDPDTLFGHLAQLIEFACSGKLKSLLIYGGPGTGKTFTIMKVIKEKGLVSGKDYVKLSGKASAVEIYKTLFMFRDDGMVVFDDLDSMWKDKDASNILKAALDTSPVREISWASANNVNVSKWSTEKKKDYNTQLDKLLAGEDAAADEEEEDEDYDEDDEDKPKKKKKEKPMTARYPSTFEFTGRVVFISNLKKEEFDTAIMSRSAKINMDLTPTEILQRMKSMLGSLGGDDVPVARKQELLDHLMKMHGDGELDAVTMREFVKGMNILRSGAPNWKDLIQYA